MTISPVPAEHGPLSPYMLFDDAAKAIDFYDAAFGAVETLRLASPTGGVGHASLTIGKALLMLADKNTTAEPLAQTAALPVSLHLYVENVDGMVEKALAAGANLTRPVQTHFYGDRSGTVTDPFGYVWHLSSRVENVSAEEIARRMQALFANTAEPA